MTPRQKERLSLYQQVIKNCNDNSVICSSESLRQYLHGFRSAVAGVFCIDYLAAGIKENKNPTIDKLYYFLFPFADSIGRCLLDFADERNNIPLREKTTYLLSQIKSSSHDIRSASFVTIADTLDEWLASLECYGMDGSILTSFNISIENYMGIAPSLSNVLSEPEAYQVCFGNILRTANLILKDRIDGLMDDLSEEHQHAYLTHRRIRTYADINYLV